MIGSTFVSEKESFFLLFYYSDKDLLLKSKVTFLSVTDTGNFDQKILSISCSLRIFLHHSSPASSEFQNVRVFFLFLSLVRKYLINFALIYNVPLLSRSFSVYCGSSQS